MKRVLPAAALFLLASAGAAYAAAPGAVTSVIESCCAFLMSCCG